MLSKNILSVSSLNVLVKNSKCVAVPLRRQSLWTSDRIIKSPYKDVDIPNFTLYDYVWQNLDRWPEKTATVCAVTGRGYTYEQCFKLSNNFAANLRKKFGVRDGDTVAVMLPNIPDFAVVAIGILGAGGVMSTINPIYTAHEVQRQLLVSNAKLVITSTEIVPIVKEALKLAKLDIKIIAVRTTDCPNPDGAVLFNELSEDDYVDKSCLKEVRRSLNDVCLLPYSSGTTGLPKGVELTNKNIIANCLQISDPALRLHQDTCANHQDVVMAVLPFFHSYGLSCILLDKMAEGLKLVTLPKFNPKVYLEALEKYKCNILYAAPPMILLMTAQATSKGLQHINTVINGAAPLGQSDAHNFFKVVQRDLDFRQGYGLTETSPVVAMGHKGVDDYGCVGYIVGSTLCKIVDGDLKSLGPNEKGELLIKGPQVMPGYKDNPKANAEAFTEDGWFRSGDLAIFDDKGILSIADRLKELIKVKGFQVPPAELEAVLRDHPSIVDAAVIGVPHPTSGEAPKAFVVLKEGLKTSAKDISEFVKERVAAYKRIDDITFLDSIPKNTSGKIMRRVLKDKYC